MNNKYYKQLGKQTPIFSNFREMFEWQWRQRVVKETSILKKIIQSTPYKPTRFPGFIWRSWIRDQSGKVTELLRHCSQLGYLQRTKQSTPLPPPLLSKLGCLLFSTGSRNSGTTLHGDGRGGGGNFIFPSLSWQKDREALKGKVFQLILSLIVEQYKLIHCILQQKINFFIVSSFPAAAHIYVFFYMHCYLISYCKKKRKNFSYPFWWLLLHNCRFIKEV